MPGAVTGHLIIALVGLGKSPLSNIEHNSYKNLLYLRNRCNPRYYKDFMMLAWICELCFKKYPFIFKNFYVEIKHFHVTVDFFKIRIHKKNIEIQMMTFLLYVGTLTNCKQKYIRKSSGSQHWHEIKIINCWNWKKLYVLRTLILIYDCDDWRPIENNEEK